MINYCVKVVFMLETGAGSLSASETGKSTFHAGCSFLCSENVDVVLLLHIKLHSHGLCVTSYFLYHVINIANFRLTIGANLHFGANFEYWQG